MKLSDEIHLLDYWTKFLEKLKKFFFKEKVEIRSEDTRIYQIFDKKENEATEPSTEVSQPYPFVSGYSFSTGKFPNVATGQNLNITSGCFPMAMTGEYQPNKDNDKSKIKYQLRQDNQNFGNRVN